MAPDAPISHPAPGASGVVHRPLARQAPSVEALEQVSGPLVWVQVLCFATTAGVGMAWALQHLLGAGRADAVVWTLAGLAAFATAGLARRLMRRQARRLRWDGQSWWLDEQAGQAHMAWDLSRVLWLRFQPAQGGRAQLLLLTAGQTQTPWALFRTVLLSPLAVTHDR